ncbi:acyl-CoA dehydrogenase [Novispirillum sp. DQ9]|uniref:acyl-CoA dehydrogenase n=1 Tax=Novispirillum sp. DQ9 TaxID=3398612 RepID=UPI003C7B924B
MTTYIPPVRDITFTLEEVAGLSAVAALPGFEDASPDLVGSILDEAGKIAEQVIAPLNRLGDQEGAVLKGGKVSLPKGWQEAWDMLIEGGWNGVSFPADVGGMGLPNVLNTAVQEMWHSANMAFALCPMLTQGAVNAIAHYGSDAQKALYLPRMVSGEWTGTMNLTEPTAGSDLAAVRTLAVPAGDHYKVSGQKIFITYGDHEMTENIIHLVLARLPDAPAGVKGISLFIVPKILEDGSRNDVHCVSLEHKIGIHASPTAVMSFGDHGGAVGYLVGEPNRGLEYMFTMMNHARQSVGLQGLAIAERAYQQALGYALDRVQGRPAGWTGKMPTTIVNHPDVRRMLMDMKTRINAMRGLTYMAAAAVDVAAVHPDADAREKAARRVELLTPIVKGWCTETAQLVVTDGVQIHGGMGYIEETGAAQHFRDARITTIYEGTTAIQANDLVMRKTLRDKGAAVHELLTEITDGAAALKDAAHPGLQRLGAALAAGAASAAEVVSWLLASEDARDPAAAAVPYLKLMGILVGGHCLGLEARAAVAALSAGRSEPLLATKPVMAEYYAAHVLPETSALAAAATAGGALVMALDTEQL